MKIAGIVKASFIDYPGCASTVIFLGGCNFNCGYCHNPEIVSGGGGEIELPDFFSFLKKRKKFLDAVCVSGGEPTLHPELPRLLSEIKALGYRVKLDTNGSNPALLRRILQERLVDRVAMDVKGPWARYGEIARIPQSAQTALAVQESLSLLFEADADAVAYELRTTVCRELLAASDVADMARQLAGAKLWYLQTFKQQGELLDAAGSYSAYTPEEMEVLRSAAEAEGTVEAVWLR